MAVMEGCYIEVALLSERACDATKHETCSIILRASLRFARFVHSCERICSEFSTGQDWIGCFGEVQNPIMLKGRSRTRHLPRGHGRNSIPRVLAIWLCNNTLSDNIMRTWAFITISKRSLRLRTDWFSLLSKHRAT